MIEFRWLMKGKPCDNIPEGIRYYPGDSCPHPSKIAVLQFRISATVRGEKVCLDDDWQDVPMVDEEDAGG